jgi:hypothetical protein
LASAADVEVALVTAINFALNQGAAASVLNENPIRVFRGWPSNSGLLKDRHSSILNIGVFQVSNSIRNTTRWNSNSWIIPVLSPLSLTQNSSSITFLGHGTQGIVTGIIVDYENFVHRSNVVEDAPLIAGIMADLIRPVRPVWAVGPTITIPGCGRLIGRIVMDQVLEQELDRVQQEFKVSIYAPFITIRDIASSLIVEALAQIAFLPMPDGSGARLRIKNSSISDLSEAANIFRQDFVYEAEYATTIEIPTIEMLFGDTSINGQPNFS